MRKQFITLVCSILSFFALAQDQLFKKDNTKLLVKITEISTEEIRYKLHDNLNGPVYVVPKSQVSLIIYENGQHEVINSSFPANYAGNTSPEIMRVPRRMLERDSLNYYRYSQSVSMNFFNFLNNEVGIIYQKDFLKNNFNITIPLAIGIENPAITQSVYFGNSQNRLQIDRKLFEAGFGLHYYPSLRFPINYYIGPDFRYMQYSAQQNYTYYQQNTNPAYPYGYTVGNTIKKNTVVSRYTMSITNGFIVRTQSRLILNVFASLGFKNDMVSSKIVDPNTNQTIQPISDSFNLYCWLGFSVGFCFN